MSAEPARALPSSGFLRIFATFYRALLVTRRLFVASPRKLYHELGDDDGSSILVLVSEPGPSTRLVNATMTSRHTGKEKDRDRGTHTRADISHGKKQVTHTYTQEERRARERGAKGHPPGATPESVLSFYYTLLRLPSLLSSTIFLSANVTTNGARPRVREGGTRERFLLLRRPSARGSRHPEIWRVGKKIGQQRSSSATRAIFPVNCTS